MGALAGFLNFQFKCLGLLDQGTRDQKWLFETEAIRVAFTANFPSPVWQTQGYRLLVQNLSTTENK